MAAKHGTELADRADSHEVEDLATRIALNYRDARREGDRGVAEALATEMRVALITIRHIRRDLRLLDRSASHAA